jgi:hypothetical protein
MFFWKIRTQSSAGLRVARRCACFVLFSRGLISAHLWSAAGRVSWGDWGGELWGDGGKGSSGVDRDGGGGRVRTSGILRGQYFASSGELTILFPTPSLLCRFSEKQNSIIVLIAFVCTKTADCWCLPNVCKETVGLNTLSLGVSKNVGS